MTSLLQNNHRNKLSKELDLYDKLSDDYASYSTEEVSDFYLALRDMVDLINRFKSNNVKLEEMSAMEHGCGTGRPMRHLKQRGLRNIIGCDINQKMIDHARRSDPTGTYVKIESDLTQFDNEQFDFVLSCLVILVIHSREIIQNIFNEVNRTLKRDGLFIVVNTSRELYSSQMRWRFTESHMFKENENIMSGSIIKNRIKDTEINFQDYYWSDEDVSEWAARAGFDLVHIHRPLGVDSDSIDWKSERIASPFRIYILKKH